MSTDIFFQALQRHELFPDIQIEFVVGVLKNPGECVCPVVAGEAVLLLEFPDDGVDIKRSPRLVDDHRVSGTRHDGRTARRGKRKFIFPDREVRIDRRGNARQKTEP